MRANGKKRTFRKKRIPRKIKKMESVLDKRYVKKETSPIRCLQNTVSLVSTEFNGSTVPVVKVLNQINPGVTALGALGPFGSQITMKYLDLAYEVANAQQRVNEQSLVRVMVVAQKGDQAPVSDAVNPFTSSITADNSLGKILQLNGTLFNQFGIVTAPETVTNKGQFYSILYDETHVVGTLASASSPYTTGMSNCDQFYRKRIPLNRKALYPIDIQGDHTNFFPSTGAIYLLAFSDQPGGATANDVFFGCNAVISFTEQDQI